MFFLKKNCWISIVFGLSIGFFPQLCVIFLSALGFFKVRRNIDIPVFFALAAWSCVRFIYFFRLGQFPFIGILEGLFAWFLYRGLTYLRVQIRLPRLNALFLIGIFSSVLVGIILSLQENWIIERASFATDFFGQSLTVKPTDLNDDYIYRVFDVREAGIFEYSVDLRSEKSHRIAILVSSTSLKNRFAPPNYCDIEKVWRRCSIKVNLPGSGTTLFIVGGFASWKAGDPEVEIRSPVLIQGRIANVFERLLSNPRLSGLTFNPNAFGATVTLIMLLGISTFQNLKSWVFLLPLYTFFILLSGSRSALIAGITGLTILMLSVFSKRLNFFLILFCFVFALTFSTGSLSSILGRSASGFSGTEKSDQQRVILLEQGFKAFQTSPWIGVGDLRSYFVKNFNQINSVSNLKLSELTHSHNLVIQTAAESGILGIFVLFFMWGIVIFRVVKHRNFAGLAILVAIAIINFFDYLFLFPSCQIAFWAVMSGFPIEDEKA